MKLTDIDRCKKIFLIGIGGCGVSAIAKILHQMGFEVFGSDAKESSNTIRLRDLGIKVFIEHNTSNIRAADLVVYSSAISPDNVEFAEAKSNGIPIIRRAEMLSWIMSKFKFSIALAGTHGKTTTTSMISKIFLEGGLDPTYLIGGETDYVDGNARLGKGLYCIAEADESDGSFLELNPNITVLTNMEPDHMEYFGDIENLKKVFNEFINKTDPSGLLVVGTDCLELKALTDKTQLKKITYGIKDNPDIYARNIAFEEGGSTFEVVYKDKPLGHVRLPIPGEQNITNSLGAIVVSYEAGIPFSSIASTLHSFSNAKRRFQIVGEVDGIVIVDDYAHHPTEIKATIAAAKKCWKGKRIISVFQPHRYTRTLNLFKEFGEAFLNADMVILTDIYSAGEQKIKEVSGKLIFDEVKNHQEVSYIARKEEIPEKLIKELKKGDMVLIMGAGDINTIAKEIISRLKIRAES